MIMIYQAVFKPLKRRFSNRLELTNEFLINILSIILMTFTELVGTNQARSDMGQVQIIVLLLYISINIIVIFKNLVLSLYLLNKKCRKRMKNK